jgi:hypothetical protein
MQFNRLMQLRETLITPPGGWRYEQPETGVVIRATTLKELHDRVVVHRRNNDLNTDKTLSDIHNYLCASGAECFDTPQGSDLPSVTVNTVLSALKTMSGGMLGSTEAGRRAEICKTCPMNVEIKGCFGCRNIIPTITKHILGKQTFGLEKRGCKVCGCSLSAKVWFESTTPGNYPSWCWAARQEAGETDTPAPIT